MKNRNQNHSDDWGTPDELIEMLDKEFKFDFDPCPLRHDTDEWDGLVIDWGKSNFVNPPYSRQLKEAFVRKAVHESRKGKVCVVLLPASTSTQLFHDVILPNCRQIRFVERRIRFQGVNTFGERVTNIPGMHDSMLVIFDGRRFAWFRWVFRSKLRGVAQPG